MSNEWDNRGREAHDDIPLPRRDGGREFLLDPNFLDAPVTQPMDPKGPEPTMAQQEMQLTYFNGPKSKPQLHWYAGLAYTVVIITCVIVLLAIYDVYHALGTLQDNLSNLGGE